MSRSVEQQITLLSEHSACDVSDALLKLEKPIPERAARAGYLVDLGLLTPKHPGLAERLLMVNAVPFAPTSPFASNTEIQPKIIGKASTLKLINRTDHVPSLAPDDPHAIPKNSHWADETEERTVLVIEQPPIQTCAAVGGIMAARMKMRGLLGCVVAGRVRDLTELRKSGLPIWAHGRSTVGSGAESKVFARNIDISINEVSVSPGDIVFCDPLEGVVIIPQYLVDQVIDLIPTLVAADEKVKLDVEQGSAVATAFRKHRS